MSGRGTLTITRHSLPGDGAALLGHRFETFTAEWDGPATVWISREFLETPPAPLQRVGNELQICQYHLRLRPECTPDGRYYIADRIEP